MIEQKKFPAWYRQPRLLLGGLVLTVLSLPIRADFFTISTGEDPPPPLPFSDILPHYAVVSVGSPMATMNQNSGPISGAVLVGIGSGTNSSGGGNGAITGGVDNSGPPFATGNLFQGLQNKPSVTNVAATIGNTAFADAAALSAAASALTPTVTLGNISGARTFVGNGDLNVIDIGTWGSPAVMLVGGPDDFFVFNLTSFGTSNTPFNIGSVDPSHILWNLTGTSGNIFQTSGCGSATTFPSCQFGTFLATRGGNFQFSNLRLTGQLINTGGGIQFVSGSQIPNFVPFAPPEPPPAPVPDGGMTLMLLGGALVGLESLRRRLRV